MNKAAQSLIKVDTSLISSSNKCSIDNSKEPCSEEALDLTMKKDKCIIENDGYSQFQVCADFVNELHESKSNFARIFLEFYKFICIFYVCLYILNFKVKILNVRVKSDA